MEYQFIIPNKESTGEEIKTTPPIAQKMQAFARVIFPAGSYKIGDAEYQYEQVILPQSTFIDMRRSKSMVESEVAGKRGKIREIIYTDDWNITLRGVITTGCMDEPPQTNPYKYPHQEVMRVKNLFEVDKDVEIIGDLFTTLGIQRVVIKDIDLPSEDTFPCLQPFTITCMSDTPYELEIAVGNNESTLPRDFQIYG